MPARTFSGETLRAFRHWLGLSQEEVGSILGLSVAAIQSMEYGEGGAEWVRYALFGWAVLVHGQAPRSAARYLGLPWKHYPTPGGAAPNDEVLAQLDTLARATTPMGEEKSASDEDDARPDDGEDAPASAGGDVDETSGYPMIPPKDSSSARRG